MRPFLVRLLAGTLLSVAVAMTLVLPGRAQEKTDWSKVSFKITKLAPNLHMIEGVGGFTGGNIAVSVGADGVLLVDSSMPPMSEKLVAAVKTLSDKPIKMIINTHFHGDHTSGNVVLGKDALVIAHQRTRERLVKDGFGEDGQAPPAALPEVTIDDNLALFWNEEEIHATVMPPAHTDSDLTVQFTKQNVVHLGDLFFNGSYPFIDLRSGGNVRGYIAAVEKALKSLPPDAQIIPGHGPLATRKDLESYLTMLKDTTRVIEKGIAAGKSVDDLKKAKVLARFDGQWGQGFVGPDDHIATLYAGLKGTKAR